MVYIDSACITWKTFLRSSSSETFSSELQENIEEVFLRYTVRHEEMLL